LGLFSVLHFFLNNSENKNNVQNAIILCHSMVFFAFEFVLVLLKRNGRKKWVEWENFLLAEGKTLQNEMCINDGTATHVMQSDMPLNSFSPSAFLIACRRVLTTSNGLTARAAVEPAAKPARKEHLRNLYL